MWGCNGRVTVFEPQAARVRALPVVNRRIDDAIRRGQAGLGCVRWFEADVGWVHLCPVIDAYAPCCSRSRNTTAHDAGAAPQHNDVVQTLPLDRADQAFGVAVLPRRACRGWVIANAKRSDTTSAWGSVAGISIMDQITGVQSQPHACVI